MEPNKGLCCEECFDRSHGDEGFCNTGKCPCHTDFKEGEPTACEEKEEIKIVPSPRIDYCGSCNKDHGFNCPKDEEHLTYDCRCHEPWDKKRHHSKNSCRMLLDVEIPNTQVSTQDEWQEKLTELMYGYKFPNRIVAIKDFIRSLLIETTKAENDRWMNQPANEHDARIRADEREKVAREIGEEIQAFIAPFRMNNISPQELPEKYQTRANGFNQAKEKISKGIREITQKYYSPTK